MAKMPLQRFPGLTITIEGEADDLDSEQLLTAGICNLIEWGDTDHWQQVDFDASSRFYDAELSAVARHFYNKYSQG